MRPWRSLSTVATVAIVSTFAAGTSHADTAGSSALDATGSNTLADLPIDIRPDLETYAALFGPTTGSEVALTGADAWHAAGIDGTGIRVGVIDFFDASMYWDISEHGPVPIPGVTAICLDAGVGLHGRILRWRRPRRRGSRCGDRRDRQGHGTGGRDLHRPSVDDHRLLQHRRLVRGPGRPGHQPLARQPLRRARRWSWRDRQRRLLRRVAWDHLGQLGRQQRKRPLLQACRATRRRPRRLRPVGLGHVPQVQRMRRARRRAVVQRLGQAAVRAHRLRRLRVGLATRISHRRPDRRQFHRAAAQRCATARELRPHLLPHRPDHRSGAVPRGSMAGR